MNVYNALFVLEAGCMMLLLAIAWTAGNKASRLLNFGSAERLARRSRKLLSWTAFATLPAIGAAVAVCLLAWSFDRDYWIDRAALLLPAIVLPVAGIWFSSLPRILRLWLGAKRLNGAPVPAELAGMAASPAMIVPFRAAAIGAGASFFCLLGSPSSWGMSSVAAPALLYLALAIALRLTHRRKGSSAAAHSTK